MLILGWLRRRAACPPLSPAFVAFVLVGAVLALVEIVQPFVGADPVAPGLGVGLLGAGGALVVAATWTRGVVFCAWPASRSARSWSSAAPSRPAGSSTTWWRQRRDAPMIASFEDDLELTRWCFGYATGSRAVRHVTTGLYSLRVDVEPAQYPGATMSRTPETTGAATTRWRSTCTWTRATPLEFVVTVSDEAHDNDYHDRFNQEMQLGPGDHQIDIPLADVEAEPRGPVHGHEPDRRLPGVRRRPDRPRTFHLDAVRLRRLGR